ncbi:hypothetical protein GOBAR_DD17825 [Gossypium barbadense]|nr:hypothetical protein GOBAR_DD17825 [Gossypium barbadense]
MSNKAICLQDAQNVWRQQLPQAVQCKSQFIQQPVEVVAQHPPLPQSNQDHQILVQQATKKTFNPKMS